MHKKHVGDGSMCQTDGQKVDGRESVFSPVLWIVIIGIGAVLLLDRFIDAHQKKLERSKQEQKQKQQWTPKTNSKDSRKTRSMDQFGKTTATLPKGKFRINFEWVRFGQKGTLYTGDPYNGKG